MSLSIASLNSGSNGNCYYIGSETDALLIDAGLTAAETLRRMQTLGIDRQRIRGLFISHEHIDHIRGLEALSASLDIPVYINQKTRKAARLKLDSERVQIISSGGTLQVGSLEVLPFSKKHDASDPLSFLVRHQLITAGVFTDIGRVCDEVRVRFRECHAAILESNYDPVMLREGRYPVALKNRISGGLGHLSNLEALELFQKQAAPHLSLLLLGHLSAENNHPALVAQLFAPVAGGTTVAIAGRHAATPIYNVVPGLEPPDPLSGVPKLRTKTKAPSKQLSLFDFPAG